MSKDVPKKKRNTVLRAGRDNKAKQQSLLSRGRTPVTFGLQITLSFTVQLFLLLALNMTDQGRGGGCHSLRDETGERGDVGKAGPCCLCLDFGK